MKDTLTKLFWPILSFFEKDASPEGYKPSHRVALNVLGTVFVILSLGSGWAVLSSGMLGGLIPVVVFFCLGSVAVLIGWLGSDGAVCKIWGTK